jgi:hypothetical protein
MLVLNHELRFPLVSIVDGVGFTDLGNVFRALQISTSAAFVDRQALAFEYAPAWFCSAETKALCCMGTRSVPLEKSHPCFIARRESDDALDALSPIAGL